MKDTVWRDEISCCGSASNGIVRILSSTYTSRFATYKAECKMKSDELALIHKIIKGTYSVVGTEHKGPV